MSVPTRNPDLSRSDPPPAPSGAGGDPETAAQRSAKGWVQQFVRTLKTYRLYEANNPTLIRFIDDLAENLARLTEEHGPLTLRFSTDDVQFDGVSMYAARSRDDNLAMPFYRDGIRSLTLSPGIVRSEVDHLVSAVARASTIATADHDLVTLLWEAHLEHIDLDYVPAESEVGSGGEDDSDDPDPMPWPVQTVEADQPGSIVVVEEVGAEGEGIRSDDWAVAEYTVEVEAGFAEIESLAPTEIWRLHEEYRAEHAVPLTTAAIAIVQAYVAASTPPVDTGDLARFLPRVLREALDQGHWRAANACVGLLVEYGETNWSREVFLQELMQPVSVTQIASRLDLQDLEGVRDFLGFTRILGDTEVDLLVAVIGQSGYRRTRRVLSEAVARRCRDNPERLAPWLADPRVVVVRNVVNILGGIGSEAAVPLLETVARHPDPQVGYAVVAALMRAPLSLTRHVMIELLEGSDTRMFCSVLHQLGREREPATARRIFEFIRRDDFERRPAPEKRAAYLALAQTAGDELIPELEDEMMRGNWLSLQHEDHRTAVARCLARIGTTESMLALERGTHSKRGAVRRACEEALLGWAPSE